MMAGKFEWQFKYRDEADVNAPAPGAHDKCKKSRFAGTSAIRQIRFTLGFWENDNHCARWRACCGALHALVTVFPETAMIPREAAAYRIARSEPDDDTANGEAAREQRAIASQPPCSSRARIRGSIRLQARPRPSFETPACGGPSA